MRVLPRRAGVLVVAALGLAGVGIAHVLEYLALVPDQSSRARVLEDTGHHYLPSALGAAGFLALVALVVVFVAAIRHGAGTSGPQRVAAGSSVAWARLLPVAQVLAFVAMEVGERVASGASLSDIGPVLVLGLPLQVLAGVAGGRLLATLARAGEHLGRALAGRPTVPVPRIGTFWRPVVATTSASALPGGPTPARGPPLLLASV